MRGEVTKVSVLSAVKKQGS